MKKNVTNVQPVLCNGKLTELHPGNGFKWSPKNSAWQRLLNDNGRRAAEYIVKQLEG